VGFNVISAIHRGTASSASRPGSDPLLHAREATTPSPWESDDIRYIDFTYVAIRARKEISNLILKELDSGHSTHSKPQEGNVIQPWLGMWWWRKSFCSSLGDGRHIDCREATSASRLGSEITFTVGKRHSLHAREGSKPSPWGSHDTFTAGKRRHEVRRFYIFLNSLS
jgi:hypothetical protein